MTNRIDAARLQPLLLGVALGAALLAALALLLTGRAMQQQSQLREHMASLTSLSQNIPLQAGAAVRGSAPAFDALAASRSRLERVIDEIDAGKSPVGLLSSPSARVLGGESGWPALLEQSQAVLDGRAAALQAQAAAARVRELTPQLLTAAAAVLKTMGPGRPDAVSRNFERFELRAQAVEQDLAALADGTAPVEAAARRLTDSLNFMGEVAGGVNGEANALGLVAAAGAAAEPATGMLALYRDVAGPVQAVIGLSDQLEQMQAARNALTESGAGLSASLARIDTGGAASRGGLLASPWLPLVFIVITLLALLAAAWVQRELAALRLAAERQARQNERNQQAILRLLDELSNLADGDLTVQATVTEDITGAIADSINYAIDALRELVVTINDSAVKLDAATRQTQALSTHLAKASSAQSKQIGAASESIAAMAASTEEVSGNAERSADVARHSVDIAHKGGDAVRRTIDGMNAIRENIQETSKRIKRLGESSQEIGNIVELINDIAEQTNILALNASIQASMAGEAGRGFAVVADEVQRLAERAANATRQIEVLVRTIQADTNEAVVSMERTTTDVVGGALLAENAGAALEEIEQVSNQIASLVQNISASSRQQAGVSQSISRNMQVLREISSQTAESTTATSTSIGKLAELAAQLRRSVAGFRLPGSMAASITGEFPVLRADEAPPAASDAGSDRVRRIGSLAG
ncbi:MAG TPA: methyl-accepting chemotaxis protein [Steroidobacteraceae bacterium]